MAATAIPAKPRGLALMLRWQRVLFVLAFSFVISLFLGLGWKSSYASLLVRPDNTAGRTLYGRLGYKYAGPYRNEPGGPVYDLLLLEVDADAW
jgi:ribosomal protein S18 acetylase RimI-like enzyme